MDDFLSILLSPSALPTPALLSSESVTDGHLRDGLSFTSGEQPSPISSTSTPPCPLTPILDADFELPPPRDTSLLPISPICDGNVVDISWSQLFRSDGGPFAFEACLPPWYCAQDSTEAVDGQTDLSAFPKRAPLADKDGGAMDSHIVVAPKPEFEIISAW